MLRTTSKSSNRRSQKSQNKLLKTFDNFVNIFYGCVDIEHWRAVNLHKCPHKILGAVSNFVYGQLDLDLTDKV